MSRPPGRGGGRRHAAAQDGTRIEQAAFYRDPLSPPFHVNLVRAIRFLQASLLVPFHTQAPVSTRALPIRFEDVPRVKKPSRTAAAAMVATYRAAVKVHNLSQRFVTMAQALRHALDTAGAPLKILVLAVDGSFCNRTCFRTVPARTELIGRTRKDAKLCRPAAAGSRRVYDVKRFTPEEVRHDEAQPWRVTKVCYGGKRRKIRYKEVDHILWRGGARRRLLRCFVVAPTPYRKRKSGKQYYRQPAYLLTTDLTSGARGLLQIYFDRWQIEVNHREEKDTLGIGQAQLWNPDAVPKQPALSVAAYSALLLASLLTFGIARGSAYAALPKWRRHARRPSCLDLVTLLRKELVEHPELVKEFDFTATDEGLTRGAAA